jgi:hypothetical protein
MYQVLVRYSVENVGRWWTEQYPVRMDDHGNQCGQIRSGPCRPGSEVTVRKVTAGPISVFEVDTRRISPRLDVSLDHNRQLD